MERKKEMKLKACPFCGSKAEVVKFKEYYRAIHLPNDESFRIQCNNCMIQTQKGATTKENIRKALQDWNTRKAR